MKNKKKLIALITSICALNIVSTSIEVISFANEEDIVEVNELTDNAEFVDDMINFKSNESDGNISIGEIPLNEEININVTTDNVVVIPININNNPGFKEISMNLSIDDLEYTIEEVNSNLKLTTENSNIQLYYSNTETFNENGELFKIYVTIPENTNQIQLNISDVKFKDIDDNEKYISVHTGTIINVISIPDETSIVTTENTDFTTTEVIPTNTTKYTSTAPKDTTTTKYTSTEPKDTTTTKYTSTAPKDTTTTKYTSTTPKDTTTTKYTSTTPKDTTTTKYTSITSNSTTTTKSVSNTSKGSTMTSNKTSSSKTDAITSIEKEEKSMNTGSKGILNILITGLISISTAVAVRKNLN